MIFSPVELKYICDAVGQFDIEFETAPGNLLQRLETWKENQKELCRHIDTKRIYGFPRSDGTTPLYIYCNECGTQSEVL